MRIAITESRPRADEQFAIATTFMDAAMMFHPWCPREEYAMLCEAVRRGSRVVETLVVDKALTSLQAVGALRLLDGLTHLPETGGFDEAAEAQTPSAEELTARLNAIREKANAFLSHVRDLVDPPEEAPAP